MLDNKKYLSAGEKRYLHFDFPVGASEAQRMVDSKFKKHVFLPFLTFDISFKKHPKKIGINKWQKKFVTKTRPIALASHHDAVVYSYYADILNEAYDEYTRVHKIDVSAIAYRRKNKERDKRLVDGVLSSTTSAKEVIDYIANSEASYVMRGDFKGFFDNLNHDYLMHTVKEVVGSISSDLRTTLKGLMKYRSIKRDELESILSDQKHSLAKRRTKDGWIKSYMKSGVETAEFLKNTNLLSSRNRKGIPQGTSLSAVLANVYMVEFDSMVTAEVEKYEGIYRRYSDDFIIVLPSKNLSTKSFVEFTKWVQGISKGIIRLQIEEKKTQRLFFQNQQFNKIELQDGMNLLSSNPTSLDYLGFAFSGSTLSLRPKTIYKFQYRGRRALSKWKTASKYYRRLIKNPNKPDLDYVDVYRPAPYSLRSYAGNKRRTRAEMELESRKVAYIRQKIKTGKHPDFKGKLIKGYIGSKPVKRTSLISYGLEVHDIFTAGNPKYKVVVKRQIMRQRNRLQRGMR